MASVISSNLSYTRHLLRTSHRAIDRTTHPFLEQQLASILQTFPALLDTSPPLQHAFHLLLHLVNAFHERIAGLEVVGYTRQMRAEVRFLAMRD